VDDLSAHEAHEAIQSIIRDSAESNTVMVSDWVIVAAYEDMGEPQVDDQLSVHVVRSPGLSLYGMLGLLDVGSASVN
jgi:hypothetical protein